MTAYPILCAAHTDPYILEQAYEQDEAASPVADHKEMGYQCRCGQQLTFGDWVYGSDTLYDCPACGTRHNLDDHDPSTICDTCDESPCTCDTEPDWAGDVTGYDNGPTFW